MNVNLFLVNFKKLSIASLLCFFPLYAYAYESEGQSYFVQTLTQQKDVIWGFDFLPEGDIIFTERRGALKILTVNGSVVTVNNTPTLVAKGQGGLLDVRVHPNFVENHWIYLTYTLLVNDQNMTTALGRAHLDNNTLVDFEQLFAAVDANENTIHFGSRIEFDQQGHLFLSVGERDERHKAQNLNNHNGKILRLNEDGTIPSDNPFVKYSNAKPEIWSLGHRNPQGLVMNTYTHQLWEAEFGPMGGDEINVIHAGKNYGWPVITYGREYFGASIGEGYAKEGLEQPVTYYVPSISPSGISFYDGDVFKKWQGNLFLAALSGRQLRRLTIKDNKVIHQEAMLTDLDLEFRHVRQNKEDGLLYFSTNDGKLARLTPSAIP